MMELLAHLIGDYLLQPRSLFQGKQGNLLWSLVHGMIYSIPFLWITQDLLLLSAIAVGHGLVDFLCLGGRWAGHLGFTGMQDARSIGWVFVCDNTLHLTWNHLVLHFSF